ncbi:MAG: AGCS family alanine or glycine:cation symporter, partial [Colwellia sp.]
GVKKYTFDPKKLGIDNADFWAERYAKENPEEDNVTSKEG